MRQVLQHPNSKLRDKSKDVKEDELETSSFKALLHEMRGLLSITKDGIALAAPQIGVLKRVFVISPKVYEYGYPKGETLIYINPVIKKKSTKKSEFFQGCLSVRNIFGNVRRSEKVTIEAIDESGKKFTRGASGLVAEIFQHEIDHFDGKLFIDDAKDLREILPESEGKD